MCKLLAGPPKFELLKGIVHITDEYGERAMSLGDFVVTAKCANQLARKWVGQTNVVGMGQHG